MTMLRLLLAFSLMFSAAAMASEERHSDLLFPIGLLGQDQSSLKLSVDSATALDIISPDGLTYNIGQGTVNFDIFGPLFCFGLAGNDQASGLTLKVRNSNGDPVIDGLSLSSDLSYRLTNSEIAMLTPPTGACFYESVEGFGLAGVIPQDQPEGRIFRDRFVETTGLSVRYLDVPLVARVDEPISYTIELANTGLRDLTQVAVQELYPRNNELFDVVLRQGRYSCVEVPSGDSVPDCADGNPVQIPELGFVDQPWIRGENLVLPRGTSVRFEVEERPVATRAGLDEDDVINSRIDLYLGAVVRDGIGGIPVSSSDTATIRIAGPAESLLINDGESELQATANGADEAVIVVQALDAFGGVPNVTIESQVVSGDAGAIQIAPSAVTDNIDGSARFIATTTLAGAYEVEFTATIDGQAITTVPETLEFAAGPATALRFVTQPDDVIVGQPLNAGSAPVSVEVIDAFGNRVLADKATDIGLTLDGGSGDGGLTGGEPVEATDGVAIFAPLSVDRAAEDYFLTASASFPGRGGITPADSEAFTVTKAATSVSITGVDPEPTAQVNQTYRVSAAVAGGFLPGGNIEVSNGESNCVIAAPSGSCNLVSSEPGAVTLTASYDGDDNNFASLPDEAAYTIIAGDPHRLVFSVQPADAVAGEFFDELAVSVLDQWDNLVDWDNTTVVELELVDAGDESVSLGGPGSITVEAGTATFNNLFTTRAGSGFRINATSTAIAGITSNSFDVSPAEAASLEFLAVPDDLISGLPLSPPVQVGVVDAFGNVVISDDRSINLRIGDGESSNSIATRTAFAGVASFDANVPPSWYGRNLVFEALGAGLFQTTPVDVSAAAFEFFGFNAIVAGQTTQATVAVDASASELPGDTPIRYLITLLDSDKNGVSGIPFTYCADGPDCTVFESLPATDEDGQAFFGPEAGITATEAGILADGGTSSLFEFELSPEGTYQLLIELLEVDPADSNQLDWLGQGQTDVTVTASD